MGHDPGQHAAYVKSWVKALREDPLEIMRACRDAEHIRDYVLELEMRKEKSHEQSVEREQDDIGMAAPSGAPVQDPAQAKTYLHVAYKDKEAAKALGARWDGQQKQWYAPEGTDLAPLRRFMTPLEQAFAGARTATPAENLSPQEEFAHKLADMGLDLKGRLPELDGKIHRVPLLSKNGQGMDGSYCLHGDGVPAGWAQNHVTGEKVKLVATGVVLSPEERERQQRERPRGFRRRKPNAPRRTMPPPSAARACGTASARPPRLPIWRKKAWKPSASRKIRGT